MKQPAGYTLLEHTADAGLIAEGVGPQAAFSQATWGMFAFIAGQDPLEMDSATEPEVLSVEVQGQEWDDLLVNWLAEVLFYFDTEGLIPHQIDFSQCEPPGCVAVIECVRVGGPEDLAGVGVKAITYHQLYVEVEEDRTELRVIFDI